MYELRDKRSKNGAVLRLEIMHALTEMAELFLNHAKSIPFYKILTNHYDKDKIDLYFKKFIFNEFIYVSSTLAAHKWHVSNSSKFNNNILNISPSRYDYLLKYIFPEKEIEWIIKRNIKDYLYSFINWIKDFIKTKLDLNTNSKYYYSNQIHDDADILFSIQYSEGLDLDKRSDIFWFPNSEIQPKNVIVYFESEGLLNSKENYNQAIARIKKYGFKYVSLFYKKKYKDIFKEKYRSNKSFNNKIFSELKSIKPKNMFEKFLYIQSIQMVNKINKWYNFFKTHNIKLHYEPTEAGLDHIIKNIALDLCDGLSIARERTFMFASYFDYYAHFSSHVHFTWGRMTSEGYKQTNNIKKVVLMSGYPYGYHSNDQVNKIKEIKQKLESNGAKKIILLLDDSHDFGTSLYRFSRVYTPVMVNFYNTFLNFVIANHNIGLIIKPKKYKDLKNLQNVQKLLKKAINTGRCYVSPNPLGLKPIDFSRISDFVVATGPNLSGSLMESVLTGTKGVYYDYPNRKPIKPDFYKENENKIIFIDFDKLVLEFKEFINSKDNSSFGDWDAIIKDIDPFMDEKGGERIGRYINYMLQGYKMGLNRKENLEKANNYYAKIWGRDKVILYA